MNSWNNITVTDVDFVMYVPPASKKTVHTNRKSHGFVLNDSETARDYLFSDGTVIRTEGNDLFYLPKGSSYRVRGISSGGCYAINFDADICQKPFCIKFRNPDIIRKTFKDANKAWISNSPVSRISIIRDIYSIILQFQQEMQKRYTPTSQERLIIPAISKIEQDFIHSNLTVSELSQMCKISEAYFRRIFEAKYGMPPKEYIIQLKINYAKKLLESGEFTVAKIAELCGFSEACHFSREFKKKVGINPRDYKTAYMLNEKL